MEKILLLTEKIKIHLIYEQTETKQLINYFAKEEEFSNLTFLRACQQKLQEGIPFPTAWEESFHLSPMPALSPEDLRKLRLLSGIIGKSDVKTQLGGIDLIRTLLQQSLTEAGQIYQEKGKVYRSLGILGGIGIAILIL